MKKYILYVFVGLLGLALLVLSKGQRNDTIVFYGFSENKEQEVNFDYDVKVIELLVNSGQPVKKGDKLLRVERTSNPMRIGELENKITLSEVKTNLLESEINQILQEIDSKKNKELLEIDSKIDYLSNEIAKENAMRSVVENINSTPTEIKGENELKLKSLNKQRSQVISKASKEISLAKKRHQQKLQQTTLEKQTLSNELSYYSDHRNHFLVAPSDGIVGFINCNPGENYSSFSKLISLYSPHPKLVKAYILENRITSLKLNDRVMVTSSLNPSHQYEGRITGFGTRILEIPDRLNKIPELKVYGREVLIEIPTENELLKREKVEVRLIQLSEKTSVNSNSNMDKDE